MSVTSMVSLAVVCGVLSSGAVSAQPSIAVRFANGRVWIAATEVTAAEVLQEWNRRGGSKIVNADALDGPPLTLVLDGILEKDALSTILRATAGFIALTDAAAADGRSSFRTILLVPVSSIAEASPAVSAAGEHVDADALPEPLAALLSGAHPGGGRRDSNPELPPQLLDALRRIQGTPTPRNPN